MSSSFEELSKAKTLLGLSDRTSLSEIKYQYKQLIKKWHPDKHIDNEAQATEMSILINHSYEIIMNLIKEYPLDFSEDSLKKHAQTPAQWWEDRFGFK